jgi:hypothetical protein
VNFTLRIGSFPLLSGVLSTGHYGSWMYHLQLGPGAGYRWVDLPGYSSNGAHRFRVRLYISGRTWSIGRKVRDRRGWTTGIRPWFSTPGFISNANLAVFPQW